MTTIAPPICLVCKHYDRIEDFRCAAFPNGIPDAIIESAADHRKPYHGDNGIRFEKDPSQPDELVNDFLRRQDRVNADNQPPAAPSGVTPKRPVRTPRKK